MGQLDAAQITGALPRAVHAKHMHAAQMGWVHPRIGIDLFGHVAAGNVDHRRRLGLAGLHVEIALQLDAFKRNFDPLHGIGRMLHHLFISGNALAMQVALLVIGLEHRMLRQGVIHGSPVIKLECGCGMSGGVFFACDPLKPLGELAEMF